MYFCDSSSNPFDIFAAYFEGTNEVFKAYDSRRGLCTGRIFYFNFRELLVVRGPLLFFSETDLIYNYLHIVQKWTKNQCGKLKKFQDLCPRDMESCHLTAARRVQLWSLNSNLFFEELHKLIIAVIFKFSLATSATNYQTPGKKGENCCLDVSFS